MSVLSCESHPKRRNDVWTFYLSVPTLTVGNLWSALRPPREKDSGTRVDSGNSEDNWSKMMFPGDTTIMFYFDGDGLRMRQKEGYIILRRIQFILVMV